MRGTAALCAFVTACAGSSLGQGPSTVAADTQVSAGPPTEVVQVVRLALAPATQPQPAMKYQLLPPFDEQVPGEGISLYLIGLQLLEPLRLNHEDRYPKLYDNLVDWMDMPMDQLPVADLRRTVDVARYILEAWIDRGARHRQCTSNLPIKKEGINLLLPHLTGWRMAGKFTLLRSRLAVIDGRFDEAIHSMQTGFAMARHVADEPILISGLVGVAIAQLTFQAVEDIQQKPGSPNLYWALADLPRPLIDLRVPLQGEASMVYYTFPELREGQAGKLIPQQWDALLRKMVQMVTMFESGDNHNRDTMFVDAMRAYRQAKQWFRQQGYSAEQVEAMPVGQVILLYSLHNYQMLLDEELKWFGVPYPQGWRGIRQAWQKIEDARKAGHVPLLGATLADLTSSYDRILLLAKRAATLQCIEAIRLYAAEHGGRLPGSLEEIAEVPIPTNPMTGRPFPYRVEGDKAILESFAPPEASRANLYYYMRYELTIRR